MNMVVHVSSKQHHCMFQMHFFYQRTKQVLVSVVNSLCPLGGAPGEKRAPPGAAGVPGLGCLRGQKLQTKHHGAAGG